MLSEELFSLVTYKFIRDIPIIIILSSVIGLSISLNKFHRQSEMVILYTAGISENKIFWMLSKNFLYLSITLIFLSTFLIPHSLKKIDEIKGISSSRPDYFSLNEKKFQHFNNLTFYAENKKVDNEVSNLKESFENIFISINKDIRKIIVAESAIKTLDDLKNIYLELFNGQIISFDNFDNVSNISNFERYLVQIYSNSINENENNIENNKIKSLSFFRLLSQVDSDSILEIHKRITSPIFFWIVMWSSIIFSKSSPRNKKNFSILNSLIFFFVTYYLLNFIKVEISPNILASLTKEYMLYVFFLCIIFIFYRKNNKY